MLSKDLERRMTWEEIKEAYPHQNVSLIGCLPDPDHIESAIVKYTEKDITYNEMIEKALKGKITMTFTSLDECVVFRQ